MYFNQLNISFLNRQRSTNENYKNENKEVPFLKLVTLNLKKLKIIGKY